MKVACRGRYLGCCSEFGDQARLRLIVVKYGRMNVMARPRLAREKWVEVVESSRVSGQAKECNLSQKKMSVVEDGDEKEDEDENGEWEARG